MMTQPKMKYSRERSQLLVRLICVSVAILFCILSAEAQNDVRLPAVGGGGGSPFVARCPDGELLTGFDLQAGDWVDAIRPVCVPDYGITSVGGFDRYPSKFGGDGGHQRQLFCTDVPTETETYTTLDGRKHTATNLISPIVLGMYVGSEGKKTVTVNRIHLICGVADPDNINNYYDEKTRQALVANKGNPPRARYDGITHYPGPEGEQSCPQGLVAVGIHGRSGLYLYALGLICGAPILTPTPSTSFGGFPPPPVALGRVQSTSPKGPPMSICARARDARTRNSPTAPALDAQCAVYLKSHPLEDPKTVLAKAPGPIRVNKGALVLKKPDANAPAVKGPIITAGSNPVIVPAGKDSGATTIIWKAAPDYTYSELYLSVENG